MKEGNSLQMLQTLKEYYEKLHCNCFNNLDKMNKLLKTIKLLKFIQEEIDNLNSPISTFKIEFVLNNFPKN